jgi:hypothetical protein
MYETEDEGYLIVGNAWETLYGGDSHYSSDKGIIWKADQKGNLEWYKILKSETESDIQITSSEKKGDGTYVIAGNGFESWNCFNFLLEIDENGNILWYQRYENLINQTYDFSYITDIIVVDGEGLIVSGYSFDQDMDDPKNQSMFILKTNVTGIKISNEEIIISGWYRYVNIEQIQHGDYLILAKYSVDKERFSGKSNFCIMRINTSGFIKWMKNFNLSLYDYPISFIKLNKDDYMVTGFNRKNQSTNSAGFIMNIDINGSVYWIKSYDYGVNLFLRDAEPVKGGIIISGSYGGFGLLLKIDNNGDEIWKKILSYDYYMSGMDLIQNSLGGLCFLGHRNHIIDSYNRGSTYEVCIYESDIDGNEEWNNSFTAPIELSIVFSDKSFKVSNVGEFLAFDISMQFNMSGKILFGYKGLDYISIIGIIPADSYTIPIGEVFGFGRVQFMLQVEGYNIDTIEHTVEGFMFGWILITF